MVRILESIEEEEDEVVGMSYEDIENGISNNDSSGTLSDMDNIEKSPFHTKLGKALRTKYEEKKYQEPEVVEKDEFTEQSSDDHLSEDGGSDKARRRHRGVTFSHEASLSDSSFLHELEKKENRYEEDQGRLRNNSTMNFALHGLNDSSAKQYGRERSNTVQGRERSETVQGRDRSGTVQGRDRSGTEIKGRERSGTEALNISVFDNEKGISFGAIIYNQLMVVVDFLMTSDLSRRPQLYIIFIIFISLMLVADSTRDPFSWYRFCGVMIVVDIITAILDHLFFVLIIDRIFSKQYNVAYMAKGFHGPLGLLATLLIVTGTDLHKLLELTKNFALWRNYVSALITVLVFVCVKNWLIRKHYTKLLNAKFSDRVFQLQTWCIVLSELATTKPPKIKKEMHANKMLHSFRFSKEDLLRHREDSGNSLQNSLPNVFAPVSIASNKIRNIFAGKNYIYIYIYIYVYIYMHI
jgi:hypothetical protein